MSDPDPLYIIRDVPDKGRGLIAASKIPKGTRILSEVPLIEVPGNVVSKDRFRGSLVAKLASLSEDQRQAFFALKNFFEADGPELGIVRTNALPLGPKAPNGGVFLNASRINHGCLPNAQNSWNENIKKLTIHACRDIEEGEEINITYLSEHANYEARQSALEDRFHFRCSCSFCSLPVAERKLSDARMDEIQKLDDLIGDGMALFSHPLNALRYVQRVLELLKTEGISDASIPRAYYDAFQVAVSHGDLARAKVFADRTLSSRRIVEGHDSPEVQKIQRLSNNPSEHRSHGMSSKWRSSITDIPTGLSDDDFELWLWRQRKPSELQLADLRSESTFPAFEELPVDNSVGVEFYETTDGGYSYRPRKHWAFLGEITDMDALFRVRLIVEDKNGQKLPVLFYTEQRGIELDHSMLEVGNTVVILYPEMHGFLDMSVGIRHENPEVLKVFRITTWSSVIDYIANLRVEQIFPVSLENMLLLSDKVQTYATVADGMRTCQGCDKKAASLRTCAKCGFFWYCDKSCQTVGWKDKGHKEDCKLLRDADLRGLFRLKWDNFETHLGFPLGLAD
ncbi:hypothetical protein ACHAPT_010928 [Fusarium lateritium]